MPRKKKTPFPPWASASIAGEEKRFIRIGASIMEHPAMLRLPHTAFRVYVEMLKESKGYIEFEMPRHVYTRFISKDGFAKAVRDLEEAGFIIVSEHNAHRKMPNKYRFSEGWKVSDVDLKRPMPTVECPAISKRKQNQTERIANLVSTSSRKCAPAPLASDKDTTWDMVYLGDLPGKQERQG